MEELLYKFLRGVIIAIVAGVMAIFCIWIAQEVLIKQYDFSEIQTYGALILYAIVFYSFDHDDGKE